MNFVCKISQLYIFMYVYTVYVYMHTHMEKLCMPIITSRKSTQLYSVHMPCKECRNMKLVIIIVIPLYTVIISLLCSEKFNFGLYLKFINQYMYTACHIVPRPLQGIYLKYQWWYTGLVLGMVALYIVSF